MLPKPTIKHMEIILKTVERCNIDCTYCYFFNGGDESYKKHPPYIKEKTMQEVAKFLKQGCEDHGIEYLQIDFHGGEPLMQKKQEFRTMCETLKYNLDNIVNLRFSMQTNGMLITPAWINLLEEFEVSVGISLDGPKAINDLNRIDKKGRGTYDRVVKGLRLLQKAADSGRLAHPGVLSVINPTSSAKQSYRHFVDELNFKNIDFLLPDLSHDALKIQHQIDGFTPHDYGKYLCELFDEWTHDNNSSIDIRILKSMMSILLGGETTLLGVGENEQNLLAFTISSNGDLSPDDTLRSASPALMDINMNAGTHSLTDFLNHPSIKLITNSLYKLPEACQECVWKKACGGGFGVHRFSQKNQFNNASSMCESLKMMYGKTFKYLLSNGIDIEAMKKTLGHQT